MPGTRSGRDLGRHQLTTFELGNRLYNGFSRGAVNHDPLIDQAAQRYAIDAAAQHSVDAQLIFSRGLLFS